MQRKRHGQGAAEGVGGEPEAGARVVVARAEVVQAGGFVPLLAGQRVVVVRVGEVAAGGNQAAVGIVAVVVRALP